MSIGISISMDDYLTNSAQDGNIESLYSILGQDPYILERIDHKPILHTPLHIAATSGNTHFAMELATLKPSLAWKLNHHGFSPIHLALESGQDQLVRSIMTVDPELLRVKSKGRVTPLHYVAEMEKVDLLAEFLSACPSCIEDLTTRCETAVHVAVKKKKFGAFKALFGWLRRVNKDEILNWKDEDGNTVLHIATYTNQPEVMKMLIKNVNKNAKNLSGLTAKDVYDLQEDLRDKEVGKILLKAKAKRASELRDGSTFNTLAGYLSHDLSLVEKRDKFFGISSQNSKKSNPDLRNYVLVVAILIVTATYQAMLSPPGGFWQDTYNPSSNNMTSNHINGNNSGRTGNNEGQLSQQQRHKAGQMIMGPGHLFRFLIFNTMAFYMSAGTILIVTIGLPYCTILSISTIFLLYSYLAAFDGTYPSEYSSGIKSVGYLFTSLVNICAVITHAIPAVSVTKHKKLICPVDNPKRHLGGLI